MRELLSTSGTGMMFVLFARALVVLFIVPLHCMVQARVAVRLGDGTPGYNNRTGFDFTHLDPMGAILLLATGVGWGKVVPVNPDNFKDRKKGIVLSSLAGPLFDMFAALICVLLYSIAFKFIGTGSMLTRFITVVYVVLRNMARACVAFGLMSLLPIPPMDGWKACRAVMSEEGFWDLMRMGKNLNYLWAALLVFMPQVTDYVFTLVDHVQRFFEALMFFAG